MGWKRVDLTLDAPLLLSPTLGRDATARYADRLYLEETVLFYHEAACPNDTPELRVTAARLD